MSISKPIINKKAATGAALVALSGFVPQPFMQTVRAATTTLSVTGSLVTGVQIAKIADIKFGKVAPTDTGGKISVSTAGAHAGAVKGVGVAGEANGAITFKVVDTTPNIDITISGMGNLVLAATTAGGGPTGTAKLTSVIMKKQIGGASLTVAVGGGTTGKVAGYNVSKKTVASVKLGGIITWGAVQPLGAFGQTLTFNMAF